MSFKTWSDMFFKCFYVYLYQLLLENVLITHIFSEIYSASLVILLMHGVNSSKTMLLTWFFTSLKVKNIKNSYFVT